MKLKILAAAIAAIGLGACADLGFGVDVDSGYSDPYFYGNWPYYDGPWYGPRWSYDFPIYSPPARPPFIGGPGPAYPPSRPQRPVRPPMNVGGSSCGVTGVPTTVGGRPRPGNGGLPSAPAQTRPSERPANGASNNNSRR